MDCLPEVGGKQNEGFVFHVKLFKVADE